MHTKKNFYTYLFSSDSLSTFSFKFLFWSVQNFTLKDKDVDMGYKK